MINRLEQRIATIELWLAEQSSDVAQEQRHLDAGTPERKYWHYGYMVALRDVLRLISGQSPSPSDQLDVGIPDTLRSIH